MVFRPSVAVARGVETTAGQTIGAGEYDRAEAANYVAATGPFAVIAVLGVVAWLWVLEVSGAKGTFARYPDRIGRDAKTRSTLRPVAISRRTESRDGPWNTRPTLPMIDSTTTPPEGWSETAQTVPGAEQTYVYHVGDGERVLVGLASMSNTADDVRLEVSSIEDAATVRRHDFAVATYDRKEDGVEGMISFMESVSETVASDYAEDERLFRQIERCIEEFDAATDSWWSFCTN